MSNELTPAHAAGSPVAYKGVPVMTTARLASAYDVAEKHIQDNHANNRTRFVEGVHFFKVVGADLKALREQPDIVGLQISTMVRHLILWTERGARRHAKILDNDRAWAVFEELEDTYFAVKEGAIAIQGSAAPDEMLRRMDGMLRMLSHKGTVTEKTVVGLERDVASLAAIVRDLVKCADGRFAVIDAVPALQIATDAKVPKAGRRPIVQEISRKLTRFCADNGYVVRRDARGTKLYSVHAVNEWRLAGGDSLIRKLVAINTSAGPLFDGPDNRPTAH